ncbi:four-carbon acid sugar kinase family protein [Halomonas sp. PAMB 3232]|uniref:3-oxo-tetronate kinase n=1 Tax=Halomonas sp. PAMB 3232 TaxID=3075221 RepID=UPI00289BED76|nr:3-oxo-tetronate kinase [Halomonas sp. PAMB 3232]WNL39292.1 four-carbon acid sugar kinase family protein [Halomonas sp. PAMB 3232]
MTIVLGAIADDFTGATDLANNLVRGGMRCVQVIGVPDSLPDLSDVDAVVVALKSRSCAAEEAIADSVAALDRLRELGARQIFFKYCSTFDSTDQGNIGPVADALLDHLGAVQTIMVPAFPINGRTVYQGHLFVGDRLLNDSGMQHHPLTPMTDADLVRVLARQTPHTVGLINRAVLTQGPEATRQRLADLKADEVRHVICDSVDESDLETLAGATVDLPLVTGGSGLGQALPAQYRHKGWLADISKPGRLEPASGSALVLSGSCSRATLAQVDDFLTRSPEGGFAIDPLALSRDNTHWQDAHDFALSRIEQNAPVLIYASADPEKVKTAQAKLGVAKAGHLVEQALSQLAVSLVDKGVGRLLVAGGETSGAVVSALGITALRIGEQIDPGVPWTQAQLEGHAAPLSLALKSGNFGGVDFFTRAFEVLP